MNRLFRPYPLERMSVTKGLVMSTVIGLFIGLFLYIFKPFNLHQYPYLLKASLLYGAVTFCATFLVLFFFPRWFNGIFNEEKWTVLKEMLSIAFLLFLIGVGNFFLGRYLFDSSDATIANEFLGALYSTVVVGMIPTVIAVLYNQLRLEKDNQENARIVEDQISTRRATAFSSVQKSIEEFPLPIGNLIYAHAQGNYTDLYYEEEGAIKKHVERITLTALEKKLTKHAPRFFRSHRSYLINLDLAEHVEGNAQGYRLQLKGVEETVPVSRGKISAFNSKFES